MSDSKVTKKYLPLGTIVYLKGGSMRMIIIGRANLVNLEGETPSLFDYTAVQYPQGYVGEKGVYLFNSEDIDTIVHEGFQDQEDIQVQKTIVDWAENAKDDYKKGSTK